MIDERGSLERRPSSWKSNKYPLPMGGTRRWYVQEAFSQDDHVLNRLPLLKYSWREIYSLIFHYLPALLCIHQLSWALALLTATATFHQVAAPRPRFPLPTRCTRAAHVWLVHLFVTLSSLQAVFFFSPSARSFDGEPFWGVFFFLAQRFEAMEGGVWVIARQRAYWSLTGSLHQRRCLSPCRLASTCQYGPRYDKQNWRRLKNI